MSEMTAFANVANIVGGYAFKGADLGATGFPVIKIAEISPPRIDVESAECVPFDKVQGLDRFKLHDGDILMAMTGATTGKVGRLRFTEPAYLNQRVARITAKAGRHFDDYVWAIVSQPRFEELVLANAHGSAQPNVSSDGIGRIQITKLPENSQIEIGHIARSLDDKIEQNRRTGRALEALARATFKAWFVDFEPVKAKAAGQTSFPGMPAAAFAALPDCFVHSELGPLPEGWSVGKVSDLGEVICGKTPPTNDPANYVNDVDFITIPDMHGKVFVSNTARKLTWEGANSQKKKLVPARSIAVSCIATPGLVVLTASSAQTNQQINTVVPREGFDPYFCYELLVRLGNEIKAGGSGGSVFHNLNKSSFEAIGIPIPSRELISGYGINAKPLFDAILAADAESSKLAVLRDYLLPRLLSGRVRVRGEIT